MPLRIVADENIPFVQQAFCKIGTIQLLPGREISSKHIKNTDVLLVRSVTKVNAALLKGSAVKIVCSATIGTDHIDIDFLTQNGIAFSNAAGSNANSVAEYVIAAILELAMKHNFKLSSVTLGIVGVGNIGKIVKRVAHGLGLSVLLNDPPVARRSGNAGYLNLDKLMAADIITLHVPLIHSGPDKTYHLFDLHRINKMKKGAILINTSRGPVVDNRALKISLRANHLSAAVLDVWENEPVIDADLLGKVEIGTPHIAGYSLDGKANGTFQIYRAVCNYFNIAPEWKPQHSLPKMKNNVIHVRNSLYNLEDGLTRVIRNVYDIRKDDENLKELIKNHDLNTGDYFDKLRKDYPVRREFSNYRINYLKSGGLFYDKLKLLGFTFDGF